MTAYAGAVGPIKKHPLGKRKLKTVTSEHLQSFIDFMSYGGINPDGTVSPPMSKGYMLRHTFTTNLISNGAPIKDVQELLGHQDASTTMSIYAHSTREAKRTSSRLLDKVSGGSV